MQNKNNALPPFLSQIFAFAQQLKDPEAAAKLQMTPWGDGRLLFAPSKPHYFTVGNYQARWCAALALKGVSIEFTIYEAPISQTKTTTEHLRQVSCQIRQFQDGLKLFGAESDLEQAELYLHDLHRVSYQIRQTGRAK